MDKVQKPVTKPRPKPPTPKSLPVTKGWVARQFADPFQGLRRAFYYLWAGPISLPDDQWFLLPSDAMHESEVETVRRHTRLLAVGEARWFADASSCVVTHAWVSGDRVVEERERRLAEASKQHKVLDGRWGR